MQNNQDIKLNNTNIFLDFNFFFKSSKKLIEYQKFISKKKILLRTNNQALMWVRAAKHFKSGKQHLFFYNTLIRKRFSLNVSNLNNIFLLEGSTLFSLCYSNLNSIQDYDIKITRITLQSDINFNFYGWYFFNTTSM